MVRPMLCDEQKVVPSGPGWVIEQKWDGWRFLFHRTLGGVRSYAGRNGSDRTGQPAAIEKLLMALPHDTLIDCELVAPALPGSTASASVGTTLSKGGALVAMVFDVLEVEGRDVRPLPWHERRAELERMLELLPESSLVQLSPALNGEVDHQALHDELIARGAEGTVSKRIDSPYVPRRSKAWVKVKAIDTLEAKVVGFKEGKNGHAGTIGAFEIELLDTGVRTSTGMANDEMRFAVTANTAAYLGRIMEVKHYGLSRDGVPKHPGFLRWREDRESCERPDVGVAPSPPAREAVSGRGVKVQPTTKEPTMATTEKAGPSGRMRNYASMKDEKLLGCIAELRAGIGDAYQRAVESGSGEPERDLLAAEGLARKRGLIV